MPQAYSPTATTPYQAYEAPQPTPPPQPTVAEQTPGYQFNGGQISKVGAVAGVLDNVLRGYMRGKQEYNAQQIMKTKAKTDNLQNAYNQSAATLYSMAQSGVNPNSPEYKQALSAVQGSWDALQDWVGQHVNDDDGGKKKKSKSKGGDQKQSDPLMDLRSNDPNVRAKAMFQIQQKMGPPVLWQVKQFQTPDAQAARKIQSGELFHGQAVTEAQSTIDKLGPSIAEFQNTPQSQWTDAQKKQYDQYKQAYQVVNPPQIEEPKPGDQTKVALDQIVARLAADPNYKLTDADKDIFRANKIIIDPKSKLHVTSRGEIISEHEDGSFQVLRGPQKAYEPRGSGGSEDKTYAKWDTYYKEHYPNMDPDERDALVRHKVEGASQQQTGAITHDAIAEPKQFDNDVLSAAIDRMRSLPQYKNMNTFDDALANLVGQGDNGYQYHSRSDLGQPDKHGKYSGDVTAEQLKNMERDLQTQIRTVLSGSKETALTPAARRAAVSRMAPLFGPAAPAGSGTTPESPQAQAAPPAAGASSPSPHGGQKSSKGEVWKSDFLRENKGATDADWQAMKAQLKSQGFEPVDK